MSSRAPSWRCTSFDQFSIRTFSDVDHVWSVFRRESIKEWALQLRLDASQVCFLFNYESVAEWALDLQAGCVSDLINVQLRTNSRTGSRGRGFMYIRFDQFSVKNRLTNWLQNSNPSNSNYFIRHITTNHKENISFAYSLMTYLDFHSTFMKF